MTHSLARIGAFLLVVLSAAFIPYVQAVPAEEFGRSITRTLQEGNGPGFTGLLDEESVLDGALRGMEGSEAFVAEVRTGLAQGLSQVGTVLVNNMGPAVKLTYVRTRTVQDVPRVLVRVDLGDRGINYIDFFLHRRPDGSWRIFDWLDYVQGQTYTDSLRIVMALMVKENPSLVTRLLGLSEVDRESTDQIAKMGRLSRQGDWAGWLEAYRTLPAKLRNSRILLVNRVATASAVGDQDEYMRAMSDLHANQGDDPTLSLALVDFYLLTEDYAGAHRAIDRLDAYTGGDAGLTNMRAGVALYEGDNPTCVRYARQAVSLDADYEDPYWNLMLAGSRAGDFEAAMEGVRGLETRFGYEFSESELEENEDLSGLVASEEWRSGRNAVDR